MKPLSYSNLTNSVENGTTKAPTIPYKEMNLMLTGALAKTFVKDFN